MKFYTEPSYIGEKIERVMRDEKRLYDYMYNYENNHHVFFLNKNRHDMMNEIKKMRKPFSEKKKFLKIRMDEILLKQFFKNYTNNRKINVSNNNMKFIINKLNKMSNNVGVKKKYLMRIIQNIRYPPIFSKNIKARTNKNRKITRRKGNTTKSRLSK